MPLASCLFPFSLLAPLLSTAIDERGHEAAEHMKSVSCITSACHSTFGTKRHIHAPSGRKACTACHEPEEETGDKRACIKGWKLARPEAELCSACHPLAMRNYPHLPVAEGKCTACHDPHESDHAHVLKLDPAADLCFSCHRRDEYADKKFTHAPAGSGACVLCHEAHSSWTPGLLVEGRSTLCFSCHMDFRGELADRRHIHDPVLRDCGECHDPHASDFVAHLRKPVKELCLGCHRGVKDRVEASEKVHGALDAEESCLACHSSHASDLPRLLSRPLLDACLGCHDRPIRAADGKELTDIAALLRENPEHHGPIRRADCSSCHDPHASRNFRLLTGEYPGDFYLREFNVQSYDLCFQCHFKELALVKAGPGITRFQHGDTNLHAVHVQRDKGRTCRACHAVHASRNPAHIADTFVFGDWKEAPVGFQKLPGGGSCAPACHKAASYQRGSKEPLPSVK